MIEESDYMTKSLKDLEDSTVKDLVNFISQHTLNIINGKTKYLSNTNL